MLRIGTPSSGSSSSMLMALTMATMSSAAPAPRCQPGILSKPPEQRLHALPHRLCTPHHLVGHHVRTLDACAIRTDRRTDPEPRIFLAQGSCCAKLAIFVACSGRPATTHGGGVDEV
jgi:hypothetical protein